VDWNFPATVRGIVEMGRYPHVGWWRRYRREDAVQVERALESMELLDLQDRQISALSGGQQQRAFLARALAQEAHVFLLDEPFTGLDADAQERLADLMRALTKEGRLIIASHHDLETVSSIYDQVLMQATRQVAFGTIAEVFTDAILKETYGRSMNAIKAAS
jgi:ABC-type Mn2+/Zn2+ transport system ATPase subunit